MHYTLHTTHRKSTNKIARKRKTYNGFINHSNSNKTKHNAFCHIHAIKKSPSFAVNKPHNKHIIQKHIIHYNFISNFKLNPLLSRKIHITTRNNRELNTYTVPIKRRHKGPNKKKSEQPVVTTPQETNTIATQTEEISNLGQGRQPLSDKEHSNPLPKIDYDNSPDYLKQLYRVFGENFVAEATRSDPQSRNSFQIIEKKKWDTMKH